MERVNGMWIAGKSQRNRHNTYLDHILQVQSGASCCNLLTGWIVHTLFTGHSSTWSTQWE
jgi:hypothetical protein